MRSGGFTLVETVVSVAIVLTLGTVVGGAGWKAYESASLAVSASNIRQLSAGAAAYLGDNNQTYWKYREVVPKEGVRWWFGFEPQSSLNAGEGNRVLHAERGPLGPYVPAGLRPDPSFSFTGKAFKPKFRSGYIGIGYNVLLADVGEDSRRGWAGSGEPMRWGGLVDPSQTVVFATCAQVNTFQPPASSKKPMVEEFYGFDEKEVTIHGRHRGLAMVAFASGNVGFVELDQTTLDPRAPSASIGRFAPRGEMKFLR